MSPSVRLKDKNLFIVYRIIFEGAVVQRQLIFLYFYTLCSINSKEN